MEKPTRKQPVKTPLTEKEIQVLFYLCHGKDCSVSILDITGVELKAFKMVVLFLQMQLINLSFKGRVFLSYLNRRFTIN
jgi:hypothetical protein